MWKAGLRIRDQTDLPDHKEAFPMMLVELTTVPPEALPVAAFKDHMRLGSGFADDGMQDQTLEGFLRASIAAIEARTGKVLIERDFSWSLTAWRDSRRQPLPLAPVSQILAVVRVDATGDETLIPETGWGLEKDMQRPALFSISNGFAQVPTDGSVRIEMTAGYGPSWSDLPADLSQAVMMLAAHFYEYRHETALNGGAMPYGVSALIERYRTVRLFMGGGA